jgi:polar amino acid transport system substrate-binding protein
MIFSNAIRALPGWITRLRAIKSIPVMICITTLCLSTGQNVLANDTKKITFSCWISADLPGFKVLENVYRESFAAIVYEFTMVHYPPARSMAVANQGITDGECARVAEYGKINPASSLDLVKVIVAKTNLNAWGYDNTIKINSPMDLQKNDYKIAYSVSAVSMHLFLSRFPIKSAHEVGNIKTGIKMLARKRFDILIFPQAIVEQELAKNPSEIELYSLGTLMVLEGYPHLHRSHRHILDAFTEELSKRVPAEGLSLP